MALVRLFKKKSLGPWLISSLVSLGVLLALSIATSWWALRRSETDIRRLQDASRLEPLAQSLLVDSSAQTGVDSSKQTRTASELRSILTRVGRELEGADLELKQSHDRFVELVELLESDDIEGF